MAAKTLKIDVHTPGGKKDGSVELPAELFDVEANIALMHQVVTAQQAAGRQGTHSTKTRGEVRGGGKKPYRQKGTGRARQGSTRAPQFTGGGVVHGPKPRDYSQRTPKKMIVAALRGALSDRARNGRIHAVTELVEGQTPSTKSAKAFLATLTEHKQVLVVIGRSDETGALSVRNLPGVHVLSPDQLNTHDVLKADDVVFSVEALNAYITAQHQAPKGRCGGFGLMATVTDPRDIILSPVISEKSYGLIEDNVYTFVVHPDSNKTQIKIAIEKIFKVKVDVGEHPQPAGQAQAHPRRLRQAQGHQARHRHAGRGQQAHRPVRSSGVAGGKQRDLENHGNSQVQADDPRSPRCQRLRFRRDHSRPSGEVAGSPAARQGRS